MSDSWPRGVPGALDQARQAFDLPADVTYLNSAFMGPVPGTAVEAGLMGLARKARPWTIAQDDFTVPVDQLRAALAALLGAPHDVDGVAITPSVSYGVSTAAANLRLAPGQVVVVLDREFPSDVYAWDRAAMRDGGTVHHVAHPPGADLTAAVLAAVEDLGERVGVVAVPTCHWISGGRVDLVEVGAATRRVGGALVVDVCQSLGAEPFDVGVVQPDFVVGATYKWLCGPYSMGFLWAAPHQRSGEPIEHGWTGRANARSLARLAEHTTEYLPGARRYDVGEVANFALMPVALAAVHLVASWGPAVVARHARGLTDLVVAGAAELGFEAPEAGLRCAHLVGLAIPSGTDPDALVARLADRGIHVGARGGSLRVSAHAFNTQADVERLIAGLAASVNPRGGRAARRHAP